ncbi:metal-dependent transcriptional regulator [Baekduia alba]|uniref:metal-dependent transcriptional regulator n=1 Tax=Baekduia alba TaxID=2997333 RepID=UPI0023412A73|nr:metal-dependent transcriptional regulator [Baekduia alba]
MPGGATSQRAADYVEILYELLFPVGEYRPNEAAAPIASRVADRLGVSRASAGEMLRRLADQGLIERGPGRSLALTATGIELAEQAIRATRVIETFLVSFMGYAPAQVHADATRMRDAFRPDMIDRLHERLGSPARCPHGWPVGAGDERQEAGDLRRLIELEEGARCRIVGIVEDDPELIGWLFDEGLVPGAGLRVQDVHPAAGRLTVGVGRSAKVVVGERAARQVYVTARG